jgi:hypothetical protein
MVITRAQTQSFFNKHHHHRHLPTTFFKRQVPCSRTRRQHKHISISNKSQSLQKPIATRGGRKPLWEYNSYRKQLTKESPFQCIPHASFETLRMPNILTYLEQKRKVSSRRLSQQRKKRYAKTKHTSQEESIHKLRLQHTNLLCQKAYSFSANPTFSLQKNFHAEVTATVSPRFKQPKT